MKSMLVALTLVLASSQAFAFDEKSPIDLRGPVLGDVYDQGSVGWCFAFAASDVVSTVIGQRISAWDAAKESVYPRVSFCRKVFCSSTFKWPGFLSAGFYGASSAISADDSRFYSGRSFFIRQRTSQTLSYRRLSNMHSCVSLPVSA